MTSTSSTDLQIYNEKCNKLLLEKDIRFAGIINDEGNLISGGFKEGLTPLEQDESKLQSFMKFVSKASIRKEFDDFKEVKSALKELNK